MRHRPVVVAAAISILFVVIALLAWQLSRSRTYQVVGHLVSRVETSEKVVALTFDDGPSTLGVEAVLPMLRQRGVKATFFLIGSELEKHPALGARIAAEGHELGNHTYSHQRMVLKTPGFIADEIERTDRLVRSVGYSGPIHVRPPYGKKLLGLPLYLNRNGRETIMWDVEPESYPDVAASGDRITRHILAKVKSGSIIILHPMARAGGETRAAIPATIDTLLADGYRFVTVSELLSLQSPEKRMKRARD